ncbi:MAG: shikimate kinase [Nostocoides sp.]
MTSTHRSQPPAAVLIGPPGAGKSTVAALVAQRLGVEVHDVDDAIEQAQARTIGEIFVQDGELRFRELERVAVASALAEERGVIALGGGAPMDPDTRKALSGHRVIFLDVGIADAARRIGFDGSRPLLAVNPRATWIALMRTRRPVYESIATWRVDTSGRTPQEVAGEIVNLLEEM